MMKGVPLQSRKYKRVKKIFLEQQGFALSEVLVAICLMALLLPFLFHCFFSISEQQKQRAALLELEDNLLLAVEYLTMDIARSTAVLECKEELLILQQNQIVYYDLGEDQQADEHIYLLEGKILYRRESSQWNRRPMANFIDTLIFFYLDEAGNPTQEAASVRAVGFCLVGTWQDQQLQYKQIVNLAGNEYI